jgi:hypothetical protein
MAFVETFMGAFLGVALAEFGKTLYERYTKQRVEKGLDNIEKQLAELKNKINKLQ